MVAQSETPSAKRLWNAFRDGSAVEVEGDIESAAQSVPFVWSLYRRPDQRYTKER